MKYATLCLLLPIYNVYYTSAGHISFKEDLMNRDVKVGVIAGHRGPLGKYQWNVLIFDRAYDEAKKILNSEQYAYVADQIKSLATEIDPTRSNLCSVDAIEDFHELREKHGMLGKINLRVFFFLDHERHAIVILGTIKKENNGPTPSGTRITIRRRKRLFCKEEINIPTLAAVGKGGPGDK
jgi:hypothetical protein